MRAPRSRDPFAQARRRGRPALGAPGLGPALKSAEKSGSRSGPFSSGRRRRERCRGREEPREPDPGRAAPGVPRRRSPSASVRSTRMSALARTPAGALRKDHAGQTVRLEGWVNRRRDHGELVFVDLRDRSGLVQVVFDARFLPSKEILETAKEIRSEFVVDVEGTVVPREERRREPGASDGRSRGPRDGSFDPEPLGDAAVPDRGRREGLRGPAAQVPLSRPASSRHDAELRPAERRDVPDAEDPARGGLSRDRDPDPDEVDAGRRARLPRPGPGPPGRVLRAAAVAAALQADPDGLGDGAVLPDRALLPGRGPAGGPAAGVHADRPRDLLPDRGDDLRARRAPLRRRLSDRAAFRVRPPFPG